MADKVYVKRQEIEAWAELLGARIESGFGGRMGGSGGRVEGKLPETGIKFTLNFTTIETIGNTKFYGMDASTWDTARVETYQGTAFNYYGKGARSSAGHREAQALLNLLTGSNEKYNYPF